MGVVVSAKVFISFALKLDNAQKFNVSSNDPSTHERLWFMLGKTSTYVVCKMTDKFDFRSYFRAGLLIDLTSCDFSNAPALHSRACAVLFDSKEYVFQCHLLRNLFATGARSGYRWNGCEWESIMNWNIIQRSAYMTGLFDDGIYWNATGAFTCRPPRPCTTKELIEAYEVATNLSDGQGKLFSLMFGFAMTRNIIYIGSAPGEGWQCALNMLKSDIRVYSFDPRELVEIENRSFSVDHFSDIVVDSRFWEKIPEGDYDFIWDVRGETSMIYDSQSFSRNDVYQIVRGEISILNSLMESPRWSEINRVSIKVKIELLNEYMLPTQTRFFPMPFTVRDDRVIHELRAVFRNRQEMTLAKRDLDGLAIVLQLSDLKNSLGRRYDEVLFANAMLMRYDLENFIHVNDHKNVTADVNLFCINRNSVTDTAKYCDFIDRTKRPMITSFFIGDHLAQGEIPVDELDIVSRNYAICDSRMFIFRKLSNLYFFTNHFNYKWYGNELTMAETYHIMNTEMMLRINGQIELYDTLRNDVCKEHGYVFYKFPNSFSVDERLCSPSGHAIRMAYLALNGKVSIGMFMYKILYNFAHIKLRWVDIHAPVHDTSDIFGIPLNVVPGHGEVRQRALWHSYDEWLIGIKVAHRIFGIDMPQQLNNVLYRMILAKDKVGVEVKKQYEMIGFKPCSYDSMKTAALTHVGLHTVESVVGSLDNRADIDVIKRYVENAPLTPMWVISVAVLKIDKVLRDYTIHIAYFRVVGGGLYRDHDVSKLNIDEAAYNAAYSVTHEVAYLTKHYQTNPHHPQHHMDDDGAVMFMPDDNLTEMAIDLAARKWQLEMPFRREIRGYELHDVSEFIQYVNFPTARFKRLMSQVIPGEKRYSLDDVRHEHGLICKNFYQS